MRKVTYGAAVSLDGFIAGPGEALDWLAWSDDAAAITGASFKGVDTLLMGRKTYEFAARSGGGGGEGMAHIRTFIFSRTMSAAPEGATLVGEDGAAFVHDGGDIIVMGGGILGSSLVEAGAVDEIGLNVHPVLLGAGTPFFAPMSRRVPLELIEARTIAKGCVFTRYRPG
jgi:dihydrofolate reductase